MKREAEQQSATLSLHERLSEEAHLISRFERVFGYPPPPIAAEEPNLTSVLKQALDAGLAPEGWSSTYDRFREFCMSWDEPDAPEGA